MLCPFFDLYLKVSLGETNEEALGEVAFKEVSYELDNLEASPGSAGVLDIIAASGSLAFPSQVPQLT